ncbi:MAG TPA: glutamyl-tRNA reductase [Solirubrobacteraceae bacterium]|nr:glutamyl-tRNA reductase [Solirubrobacteraceae bacterium]
MSLSVVGVSHRTAPLEVRERFVIGPDASTAALRDLASAGCTEALLLSTCNRTELYLHAPVAVADAPAAGTRFLASHSGMGESEADAYLYTQRGDDAVRHLFRVVTSLDSMVLGEAQIQGQVREAYGRAVEFDGGTLRVGPVLSRLFETALRVGARVRSETRLGSGAASIPSAAVALARRTLGSLDGRHAVVLGAGEMSALALQCLQAEGVASTAIVSRSEERAHAVADKLGGGVLSWDRLPALLEQVDIVAAATSAPHAVLTRPLVERALAARGHPLVLLDIALPRDVDPSVRGLAGVHLFDLDDLSQVVLGTIERRRSEVAIAEQIIDEEVATFAAWYRTRPLAPVIRELRARAEHLRQRELERARAQLRHLSPEDLETVDRLTRQLLAKLLHVPTARLRDAAAEGRDADLIEATRYLFSLEGGRDNGEA